MQGVFPPAIDVLLATYNGAAFLEEQLRSLREQTDDAFRLIVRDDGSSDRSISILEDFGRHLRGRFELLPAGPRLGASGSFSELLAQSTAPYVMFCDQDDSWDEDKVALFAGMIRELERKHGPTTPVLVHSDLRVADGKLRSLSESFWRYQKIRPQTGSRLERLLGQNVVTGSAAMMNRALVELARPVPPEAIMHDWWIALVAAAFGITHPIHRATGDYRQHGSNDTGAKRWDTKYILSKLLQIHDRRAIAEILARTSRQAQAFAVRYRDRLSPAQLELVQAYARLPRESFLRRRWSIVRYGFWKDGWLRNAGLLLRV